jgi:hypothetical protein
MTDHDLLETFDQRLQAYVAEHPGFQAATMRKPTVRVRQCHDTPKK